MTTATFNAPELQWFQGAKFGIFIHWGIYAVNGKDASWSYYNHGLPGARPDHHLSKEEYFAQTARFTAAKYDPEAWADLFQRAGARYAVLTTKHCDDFGLWPSQVWANNAAQASPAGRDLVGPYCAALRQRGLHVGLYYSHSGWGHPDYPAVFNENNPPKPGEVLNPNAYPAPGCENPAAWQRYVAWRDAQVKELCDNYSPELMWFDADWERSKRQWDMENFIAKLRQWRPGIVLNERSCGLGDYKTPEQGQPLIAPKGVWEYCVTTDRQWGYTEFENDYKPLPHLIRMLVETVGMGGNLLLNVGPRADGTICEEQTSLLEGIGRWLKPNSAAIFDTVAGLPPGYCYAPSTLATDRTAVYLFLFDRPFKDFAVRGIKNNIRSITHLASGTSLTNRMHGGASWAGVPGTLWIDVPGELCDPLGSVLKIELDVLLELYAGEGQVITQN